MEETKKEFTPRPERTERPQRGRRRRKVCAFCVDKVAHVDYKDAGKLKKYMSERGKILPRRMTGTCAAHQRQLTEAIRTPQSKQFVFYNQGYAKRRFRKKAALFCTLVSRLRQTKRTPDASFFRYSCVQFIRSSSL